MVNAVPRANLLLWSSYLPKLPFRITKLFNYLSVIQASPLLSTEAILAGFCFGLDSASKTFADIVAEFAFYPSAITELARTWRRRPQDPRTAPKP
jgi:hypothetical protein